MDYSHWRQFWDALDTSDDNDIHRGELVDYMLRRYRSSNMVRHLARSPTNLSDCAMLSDGRRVC